MRVIGRNNLGDFNDVQKYRFCNPKASEKMVDLSGQTVKAVKWARVQEVNEETGAVKEILTIETENGEIYGTTSAPFLSDFDDFISECYPEGSTSRIVFKVISRVTKAGRTCIRFEPIDIVQEEDDY